MELKIVKFFNHLGSGGMNKLTDFISRIRFLIIFWTILALGFLIFDTESGKKIFFGILIASILHFIISEGIIKHLFSKIWGKRARPYIAYEKEIFPIGRKHKDSSFPSSHMSTTLAVLTVISFFHIVIWPLALIFVILMAYARMHNGMHYLSDVIVGALLGFLYGEIGINLVNKFL